MKDLPKQGEEITLRARVIHVDETPRYATSVLVELLDYATETSHGNTYESTLFIKKIPENGKIGLAE